MLIDCTEEIKKFGVIGIPSESSIMSNWGQNVTIPKVSVVCWTYNQEDYVESTIQSFLNQKTNFPFEIVIQDDASTDNTQAIIKKYATLYPTIIKPVLFDENQYSKGSPIGMMAFQKARGDYVAMCDGDDFWVSPYKLQIQYGLALDNADIACFFHPVFQIYSDKEQELSGVHSSISKHYSLSDVINGDAGFMQTSSCFMRKESLLATPNRYVSNFSVGDYIWQMFTSHDGAIYTPIPMSVYRRNSPMSISSSNSVKSDKEKINIIKQDLLLLTELPNYLPVNSSDIKKVIDQRSTLLSFYYLKVLNFKGFALSLFPSFSVSNLIYLFKLIVSSLLKNRKS